MKIKNLLMQWFILTPLAFFISGLPISLLLEARAAFLGEPTNILPMNLIIFIPIMVAIVVLLVKIYLRIKGQTVEGWFFDNNYEYEVRHDYGSKYSLHKTRGGWTLGTKGIVIRYVIISPIVIVLQLLADAFALLTILSRHLISWYGVIDYDMLDYPTLQKVIHTLFGFVVVPSGYDLDDIT